jgi:Fe2+ transport system protein FeoA
LIPGAVCRLLKKVPTCGVIQLQVRDSVLGLRLKEARQLLFEYKDNAPKKNSTDR